MSMPCPQSRHSLLAALITTVLVAGCTKSVEHFAANPKDRDVVLEDCITRLPASRKEKNCENAAQAHRDKELAIFNEKQEKRAEERRLREEQEEKERAAVAAQRQVKLAELEQQRLTDKATFDRLEAKMSGVTGTVALGKLTEMASALNQGDLDKAAAAIHVPRAHLLTLHNLAARAKGLRTITVHEMNAEPGRFDFKVKYSGYRDEGVPTGFELKAEPTKVSVSFKFQAFAWMGDLSRTDGVATCGKGDLKLSVDRITEELIGTISFLDVSSTCFR